MVIPAEQYGRMARLLAKNMPVTIEADIKNTYVPNPPCSTSSASIRGTDKADEVVMLGAHFDSWHASTGATDNGAGVGGDDGGDADPQAERRHAAAHGSHRLVDGRGTGADRIAPVRGGAFRQLQSAAGNRRPGTAARRRPRLHDRLHPKPEHAKFAGYFNIDNGTGAIRGVYLQGNDAVAPIFREWMEAFHSLGMTTLTIRNTGGTDHQSFDAVGLPGLQFIQDPIEYDTLTHHTNLDAYERLQPGDMMKNATIAAAFAYLAANRDEMLPRKALAAPAGRGAGQ